MSPRAITGEDKKGCAHIVCLIGHDILLVSFYQRTTLVFDGAFYGSHVFRIECAGSALIVKCMYMSVCV